MTSFFYQLEARASSLRENLHFEATAKKRASLLLAGEALRRSYEDHVFEMNASDQSMFRDSNPGRNTEFISVLRWFTETFGTPPGDKKYMRSFCRQHDLKGLDYGDLVSAVGIQMTLTASEFLAKGNNESAAVLLVEAALSILAVFYAKFLQIFKSVEKKIYFDPEPLCEFFDALIQMGRKVGLDENMDTIEYVKKLAPLLTGAKGNEARRKRVNEKRLEVVAYWRKNISVKLSAAAAADELMKHFSLSHRTLAKYVAEAKRE